MNKEKVTNEILNILWKCENIISSKPPSVDETEKLIATRINEISISHCNSWLGYQSCVYYNNFRPIPAGAHFDIEWGLSEAFSNGTTGNWREYDFESIKRFAFAGVTEECERELIESSNEATENSTDVKSLFETLIWVLLEYKESKFVQDIKNELEKITVRVDQSEIAKALCPQRQYISYDSVASSQGIIAPPHVNLQSWLISTMRPYRAIKEVHSLAKKMLNYLKINDIFERQSIMSGGKVFIGHGRSPMWRELKDFVNDRLRLQWEEFNRESVAGKTTVERLQEMLDVSAFAFLIMTGEDEHANTTIHARENVIHEVGLFQGKLGFRKAIVLLEDGCVEFSNITGLTQIRFPKNKISTAFEEIRQVLEREGLINH